MREHFEHIEALLHGENHDPLDRAERLTGKDLSDPATTALGFALMQQKSKQAKDVLTKAGDTHYSMPLGQYLYVIQQEGFVELLRTPFVGDAYDTYYIYWHPIDAILLSFDTYWGNRSVNSGKLYYNWKPATERHHGATSSGGYTGDIWVGDHDCREALRFNLYRLRQHGKFIQPWVERPFLWLLNYQEARQKDYDYGAINAKRISQLPQEVQAVISPKG